MWGSFPYGLKGTIGVAIFSCVIAGCAAPVTTTGASRDAHALGALVDRTNKGDRLQQS